LTGRNLLLLAGILIVGCNRRPNYVENTGSKDCVQTFYQALIRQDWTRAYSVLDAKQQKAHSLEQFSRLAQSYRNGLGFDPEAIHIQACQEHGSEAMAHVVLEGQRGDLRRRYKDAVTLRRENQGWRIVLSSNFGRIKK